MRSHFSDQPISGIPAIRFREKFENSKKEERQKGTWKIPEAKFIFIIEQLG